MTSDEITLWFAGFEMNVSIGQGDLKATHQDFNVPYHSTYFYT